MTDTEVTVQLDKKHRALRSGDRWAVQRLRPDGAWDMVDSWNGGRRSLLQWAEEHHVYPSREAEDLLGRLPESSVWRYR